MIATHLIEQSPWWAWLLAAVVPLIVSVPLLLWIARRHR